jgi:maltose O-acetyltransferase
MRLKSIAYEAYLAFLNVVLKFPSHRLRLAATRRLGCNEVGRFVVLERGLALHGKGGVSIGDNCNINAGVSLDGRGGLRIGSRVTISPEVMILTADHDPQTRDFAGRTRAVTIGDDVWIATRAIILPGACIEDGAVVAAGGVVHGVVPAWTIVAGNPAAHIADRSRDAGSPAMYRRWFH